MNYIRRFWQRCRDDVLLLGTTVIGLVVVVLCGIFVTPRVVSIIRTSSASSSEDALSADGPSVDFAQTESLGTGIANLPSQKVVLRNGKSYLEFELAVEYDRDVFWSDTPKAPTDAKEREAEKFKELEAKIQDSIHNELSGSNPRAFFGKAGLNELKWALNEAIAMVVGRNTVREVYFQSLHRWPPDDD